MGLLEKPLISFSPGFSKSCLKWREKNCHGVIKKCGAFYVNVSSGFSSSWNSFHRYHPASLIFVIIHVAMTGKMCGKDFKKKQKIRIHLWKQQEHYLVPNKSYNIFWYILQNQEIYSLFSFPSSPTYSVKNLKSTALLRGKVWIAP